MNSDRHLKLSLYIVLAKRYRYTVLVMSIVLDSYNNDSLTLFFIQRSWLTLTILYPVNCHSSIPHVTYKYLTLVHCCLAAPGKSVGEVCV